MTPLDSDPTILARYVLAVPVLIYTRVNRIPGRQQEPRTRRLLKGSRHARGSLCLRSDDHYALLELVPFRTVSLTKGHGPGKRSG